MELLRQVAGHNSAVVAAAWWCAMALVIVTARQRRRHRSRRDYRISCLACPTVRLMQSMRCEGAVAMRGSYVIS